MGRTDEMIELESNRLKGKHIIFLGSSVTYGSAAGGISFVEHLAERNGFTYTKEAVSGTTLVDIDELSYIRRMIDCIEPSIQADAFVCQLSTNDASRGLALGEISKSYELNSFNTLTICGAMEYVIAYAKQTWGSPVIFYTGTYYENELYQKMIDELYKLQVKWGIGIIDLWNRKEMREVGTEKYKAYMADPIHPTHRGYVEWWTPIIEKSLSNYLGEEIVYE